jgi:hypothetical protein
MTGNQSAAWALDLPDLVFHAKPALTGEAMITFRFNAKKALQAVEHMLDRAKQPLDFHTLLKACYFADKKMLNATGRPIFGATYRAMEYGPVPVEIWDIVKGDILQLWEAGTDEVPWNRRGHWIELPRGRNTFAIPHTLAPAELRLLDEALEESMRMTFNERTIATHGMDWVRGMARVNKVIDYADMIDDRPDKAEIVSYLEDLGPRIAL